MTAAFAHHWTVQNGKITRFVQHTDTAKVLEAILD
jgi:ketosteroid isomerase-like protein